MNSIRVKTCGITTEADAIACAEMDVDYIGVIFAQSPRQISIERARQIRQAAPDTKLVGVFMDHSLTVVGQYAAAACLDYLQLHGSEDAQRVATLRRRTGLPVIKALRSGELLGSRALDAARAADYILLDRSKHPHADGPQFLDKEAARATADGFRVFLAGGLSPDNVKQLATSARPFAVDVCSGIESEIGLKDLEALERFLAEVRH